MQGKITLMLLMEIKIVRVLLVMNLTILKTIKNTLLVHPAIPPLGFCLRNRTSGR